MNSRILPFFALMIAVAIFFAYVNPVWTGPIAAAKTAIANDNAALSAAAAYTTRENQLAAQEAAIDPTNLAELTTMLPDSVDNVGIIVDINALAARSGILISNIDVASDNSTASADTSDTSSDGTPSTGSTDPVGSVDLSLSGVGTYAALQAFLTGIEHSTRLLDVRNLQVGGSDTGVYDYQMTMRLYWLQ